MPATTWPAEGIPEGSKVAQYANRVPQTGPTAPQAPHSPVLELPAVDDPLRSAPQAECRQKALPIPAARRAWQITPSFPNDGITIISCRREFFSNLLGNNPASEPGNRTW